MIECYYKEIENEECDWKGEASEVPSHLISQHSICEYTSCKHNKIMLELEFDENSGFRFLLLTFQKDEKPIPFIFEESMSENNLISLLLRSPSEEIIRYKMKIEGKVSSIEYEGNVQKFDGKNIEENQQCLKVHARQMQHFSYISDDGEKRYKIVLTVL
ncbi:unnamed protein product [Blepharisma stoltei]|uniref:Seven-in-absentia protein TRAF-like domain-containing protein n=1 Tax=Blepharisma stoltei TaxID=1481888 RepID=A0AAU9K048_9CILI|nr:unnamed protein product [Blepharisma stoltei]